MAVTSEVEPTTTSSSPVGAARTFDALFAEERRPMVRLAFLLVGSEGVAEELVQDAFAQVYARWDHLDEPGAYLRTCVIHAARRSARRARRERERVEVVGAAALEARELLDALGRLRPAWRAVVVLRFYGGMTQPEISEQLGLRPGTVKSRLHRALAQLREELEP